MIQKISKQQYEELTHTIKKGQFDKAETILTEWLKNEPENVMFLLDMAYVKSRQGEHEAAIKMYEKVIEIVPENPSGWAGLGFTYSQMGNAQKAIENFEKSLQYDPTNVMIHFELGEIYFEADNYEAAKERYLKAIQFGDDDTKPETMHRIIQAELGLNNIDKALELSALLVKENPEMVSAYNLLATGFYLKEEWAKAVENFEKYLKKVPDDEAAKNLLEKAKSEL